MPSSKDGMPSSIFLEWFAQAHVLQVCRPFTFPLLSYRCPHCGCCSLLGRLPYMSSLWVVDNRVGCWRLKGMAFEWSVDEARMHAETVQSAISKSIFYLVGKIYICGLGLSIRYPCDDLGYEEEALASSTKRYCISAKGATYSDRKDHGRSYSRRNGLESCDVHSWTESRLAR